MLLNESCEHPIFRQSYPLCANMISTWYMLERWPQFVTFLIPVTVQPSDTERRCYRESRAQSSISFLKDLLGGKMLFIQATPFNESPVSAEFNIEGLADAIKPLRAACGWLDTNASTRQPGTATREPQKAGSTLQRQSS